MKPYFGTAFQPNWHLLGAEPISFCADCQPIWSGLERSHSIPFATSAPAAAAGVGLLGRLVERLGLQREVVALGDEVVELLAALQHRRRAEIWRFHPRMMVNRRNSISAPLCECLHSEAMPINSAFVAPKQLNMSQAAACSLLELDTAGQSAERVNRIEN